MLILSIFSLLFIFVLNLWLGMYHGFGVRHYWFFQTLHFLGGFFVAMFLSNFLDSASPIFIGLAIVTILWESLEILISTISAWSRYFKKKFKLKDVTPAWGDTVFDIVLNFSGALVFIYFLK